MKTALSWIMAAASIFGMILNVKKNHKCFIVFAFTNTAWVIYFLAIKEYAPAFLQLVFLGSSIWGLYEWTKTKVKAK